MTKAERQITKPKRSRTIRHRTAAAAMLAAQEDEAFALRVRGWSIKEIADGMALSQSDVVSMVRGAAGRAIDASGIDTRAEMALDMERIDAAIRALAPKVATGDTYAIKELRGLVAMRARIYGYEGAQKLQISGPDGGPIQVQQAVVIVPATAESMDEWARANDIDIGGGE